MISRELNESIPDRCNCLNLCTNIQYESEVTQYIMVEDPERKVLKYFFIYNLVIGSMSILFISGLLSKYSCKLFLS